MRFKEKFDKLSKEQKVVGGLLLLLMFFIVVSLATAPAKAQLVGRGPEPNILFSVTVESTDGRRYGRTQLPGLPPLGYKFIDGRGNAHTVVGGSFQQAGCSSTRCVSYAVVLVE